MGLVSNVISNVPATQLLINTAGVSASLAPKIAVEAGLAGNLGPAASFANILALQMAARSGVSVRRTVGLQVALGVLCFIPALV
jgi:Na+/H+ antiporter NhaD/arsenite permease-like protein